MITPAASGLQRSIMKIMRLAAAAAILLIMVGISAAVRPVNEVRADNVLQTDARLEGVNIYFTEAGGESSRFERGDAGISRFAGLLRQLGANLYTLEWRTGFPSDADVIVIAGPQSDFAPDQIARLWAYVNNGGRLLLLANPVVETQRGALPPTSGFFQLMWSDFGLRARGDLLISDQRGTETTDPDGVLTAFTTTNTSTQHPITNGIEGDLAFFGARSLEVDAAIQSFVVTPLVFADPNFYGETDFARFTRDGVLEYNIGADTPPGLHVVAGAFEDPRTRSRIVLIGDADFARNGAGFVTAPRYSAAFVYPSNVRFLLNAVSWLADVEFITLTLPPPGPTETPTITPTPTSTPTPSSTPTPTPDLQAAATATPSAGG
jgi:hypothetical protein